MNPTASHGRGYGAVIPFPLPHAVGVLTIGRENTKGREK